MQTIVPHIWFDGDADEAAEFYLGAFPGARLVEVETHPSRILPWFDEEFAGRTAALTLDICGYRLTLINAGDEHTPNPAINFFVNFDPTEYFDAAGHLRHVWERLADGGEVTMELGAYPFSPCYGWVEDRYGVNWELMLTHPDSEPRPFIIPNLVFSGPVQNQAREAVDHYLSVFPDAALGSRELYGGADGLLTEDSVIFSDFQLAGQWFSATDSAVAQQYTFTPGMTLQVTVDDQEQIDRLWAGLSAVPETEYCGQCTDRFGVRWQILPTNLDELLARPGGHEKLLAMGKIQIDRF